MVELDQENFSKIKPALKTEPKNFVMEILQQQTLVVVTQP